MKKLVLVLFVALMAASVVFAGGSSDNDGTIKVGISKIVTHAALDSVEQGVQDYLNSTSIKANFVLQNANGEISTAASIAQTFKDQKCDFVLGIGTPTAQALANVFTDIPVLFAAVTNPDSAGLTASNVCGTSDLTPVATNVEMWIKATGAKAVGNIYTSSEANSVYLNSIFEETCKKLGVEPVSIAITNTSEVKQAALAIAPRIDAMYIDTDNTVMSTIVSVSEVCTANGIPLMLADCSSCNDIDFTLSMGFDYYKLGLATGKIIEGLVNGNNPSDFKTVYLSQASDFEVWVNLDNANRNNVTIPQDVLSQAVHIIENGVAK